MNRTLRLRGAVGKVRTETFMGAEHLVVPVVALVEGVIWAVNAETPELVLAEELAIAPAGWNGRPCFVDHPEDDGANKISGNNPVALETLAFGTLFNAISAQEVLDTKRLKYEAWLNKEKAPLVAGAQDIIARLEAEDPDDLVEVSVGTFVRTEETTGDYNGITYYGIWRNIVPDHHAFLPKGVLGACSVEMGCGAPRLATIHLVTAKGLELIGDDNMPAVIPPKEKDKDKRTLRERITSLLPSMKFRTNAGEDGSLSDSDLRGMIDSALRAVEPGYYGIDSVFPEQSLVVYMVAPEDTWQLFQRSYTLNDDSVTLNEDKVEVNPVTIYEPVTATESHPPAPKPTAAASPCGCGNSTGGDSMNKTERIAALITNSKGRYVDADKTWLAAVPDDRFVALEQSQGTNQPKGDPIPGAPTGDAPPPNPNPPKQDPPPQEKRESAAPKTAEEYLASLPADVADSVRQGMKIAEQRKAASIKALKDTGRCKLSDASLSSKTQDELDNLLELAGVKTQPQAVDFSANAPRQLSGNESGSTEVAPPPSWHESVKAARAK